MSAKIPATVITGFLGAGKTTLIRNLLQNAGGRRIALIINEFGELGVDGELLRDCGGETCSADDIVELTNGCICCTVADDFVPAITGILSLENRPDHIVIETSGLALPQPLVNAFNWPEVSAAVTVDGVVTVIDGAAVAAGRFADDENKLADQRAEDDSLDHENPIEELFEDQINCADMVVVNKADLIDAVELERVASIVKAQTPRSIRLVPARHGRLPAEILLGLGAESQTDIGNRKSHHELHHGDDDHEHDDFDSFETWFGPVGDAKALAGQLKPVIAEHGILRLKGFVHVAGKPMRLVVQAVGERVESYFDRDWRPDEKPLSRVVVIGLSGMDRGGIGRAITALGA